MIDTNKKELLLKQISFRGWKKFEPLDSSIEYEKPIAMGEKMINLSKNQYKFSVFIRKLRLPLNDIEALCSLPINSLASRVYDGDDNNS
ncbi:MAG: hypothetical protein FWG21_06315 [Oscillospiraceae bacterium]|nr:hypothetical protein [Oscillospiraceae bacterium]